MQMGPRVGFSRVQEQRCSQEAAGHRGTQVQGSCGECSRGDGALALEDGKARRHHGAHFCSSQHVGDGSPTRAASTRHGHDRVQAERRRREQGADSTARPARQAWLTRLPGRPAVSPPARFTGTPGLSAWAKSMCRTKALEACSIACAEKSRVGAERRGRCMPSTRSREQRHAFGGSKAPAAAPMHASIRQRRRCAWLAGPAQSSPHAAPCPPPSLRGGLAPVGTLQSAAGRRRGVQVTGRVDE